MTLTTTTMEQYQVIKKACQDEIAVICKYLSENDYPETVSHVLDQAMENDVYNEKLLCDLQFIRINLCK